MAEFNLKRPCENCPFKKKGAIELAPGRLEVIIETLKDDHNFFQCHKTVHSKRGGEWVDGEDGAQTYQASGNESVCMGALAYMYRDGHLPILARIAMMYKKLTKQDIEKVYPLIIESREK